MISLNEQRCTQSLVNSHSTLSTRLNKPRRHTHIGNHVLYVHILGTSARSTTNPCAGTHYNDATHIHRNSTVPRANKTAMFTRGQSVVDLCSSCATDVVMTACTGALTVAFQHNTTEHSLMAAGGWFSSSCFQNRRFAEPRTVYLD